MRLFAVVQGAAQCRFSSTGLLQRLPATKNCSSGTASISIQLPKNTKAAARTYRFHLAVSGPLGATTAAPVVVVERAAATANAAPLITAQPQSRSVSAGASVSFSAAASGSPAPTARWQLSSDGGRTWADIAGATADSYAFVALGSENGFEYRAVFTRSGRSSTTSPATLTVTSSSVESPTAAVLGPVVTLQPASQTVEPGAQVSFTAAASGSPDPSVQWQVSTDGGGSWANVSGATSGTVSFTAASGENGDEFRAVFANSGGSAQTAAATLTVDATTAAPVVTQQPADQNVVEAATATFTAAASGSPAPSVQWEVSSDYGSTWSPIAGATSTSYSLIVVEAFDGYEYRAVFSNGAGSATTSAATLLVSASAMAPEITEDPASQSALDGGAVTFTADASGVPTPSVQWRQSTDGGNSWANVAGATSSVYSFTASSDESGYEYDAVFTSSAGSATTTPATLTVTAPAPPSITSEPQEQNVLAGAEATFTAAASGNPTPTVQWQVSTDGGNSWANVSGATSTSYSLATTIGENGSEYRAVFTNASGSAATQGAILTVSYSAPEITQEPLSEEVGPNQTATFTAAASGDPTPSVQWEVSMNGGGSWGNVAGATAASYSFTATSSESGFEYRAVFTNAVNSATSTAATLTIGVVPDESDNWSGYAATGESFSEVQGSWTVPTVTCPSGSTGYAAIWVGIDGYTSNTVEQDGTDSDCNDGNPTYYAWYEMYGDDSVNGGAAIRLSQPVQAGDAISASVSVSGSSWTLNIDDTSQNWQVSESIAGPDPAPSQNSAEWIVERPEVDGSVASLADFGTATFTGATADGSDQSGSISAFQYTPINMVSGSSVLAAPGTLDVTGETFTDSWRASG